MTEVELIRSAARGNKDHFEILWGKHEAFAKNVIRKILMREQDVEDILQESALQVWLNLFQFKARSTLKSWIYRICANQTFMFLRRAKKYALPVLDISYFVEKYNEQNAIIYDADSKLNTLDCQRLVNRTLPLIHRPWRETIFLQLLRDYTTAEVAEIKSQSIPATKSEMHRGRMQIKDILRKEIANYAF